MGGYTVDRSKLNDVFLELEEATEGEYTVRFHKMDRGQFASLPEFEGF